MNAGFGLWNPEAGPRDRATGAWIRPIDDDGVSSALVYRTSADASEAMQSQREKFNIPASCEVRPFDWDLEEART